MVSKVFVDFISKGVVRQFSNDSAYYSDDGKAYGNFTHLAPQTSGFSTGRPITKWVSVEDENTIFRVAEKLTAFRFDMVTAQNKNVPTPAKVQTMYTANSTDCRGPKRPKQTMRHCVFCKNNYRTLRAGLQMKVTGPIVWSDHVCKNQDGKVVCPILRSVVCKICGATGDNAHTDHYCTVAEQERMARLFND